MNDTTVNQTEVLEATIINDTDALVGGDVPVAAIVSPLPEAVVETPEACWDGKRPTRNALFRGSVGLALLLTDDAGDNPFVPVGDRYLVPENKAYWVITQDIPAALLPDGKGLRGHVALTRTVEAVLHANADDAGWDPVVGGPGATCQIWPTHGYSGPDRTVLAGRLSSKAMTAIAVAKGLLPATLMADYPGWKPGAHIISPPALEGEPTLPLPGLRSKMQGAEVAIVAAVPASSAWEATEEALFPEPAGKGRRYVRDTLLHEILCDVMKSNLAITAPCDGRVLGIKSNRNGRALLGFQPADERIPLIEIGIRAGFVLSKKDKYGVGDELGHDLTVKPDWEVNSRGRVLASYEELKAVTGVDHAPYGRMWLHRKAKYVVINDVPMALYPQRLLGRGGQYATEWFYDVTDVSDYFSEEAQGFILPPHPVCAWDDSPGHYLIYPRGLEIQAHLPTGQDGRVSLSPDEETTERVRMRRPARA